MITISKPKPEDAEGILDVIRSSWYATYINSNIGITKEDVDGNFTPEIVEGQLNSLRRGAEKQHEDNVLRIAKDGEKIVGYIRLKIFPEHIEWISFYVHADYFGKGVGTLLWHEAQEVLPQKNITVEVATYTQAIHFYKKIGFVDTGERSQKNIMPVSKTPMPLMKMILKNEK